MSKSVANKFKQCTKSVFSISAVALASLSVAAQAQEAGRQLAPPPIKEASYIPVNAAAPIKTFAPVTLSVPGRAVPLEMKISMPATGRKLPIILFSHGLGFSNYLSSMHGYNPLVEFYAAHGFIVIQPTHLDSKTIDLPAQSPARSMSWRSRATDMRFILDHLKDIEVQVPDLRGLMDAEHVAAVGHSAGGHTVQLLAGMHPTNPATGEEVDLKENRIKAVVMIGAPGGDTDLGPAIQAFPIAKKVNFGTMTTPALVIAGDRDVNPMFSPRLSWRADAYPLGPSPKCLLTLFGATHSYGGVAQYDAAETTDANPERVSVIQRLSVAYLQSVLYSDVASWKAASAALSTKGEALGKVECK